jgi:hypothetical protein
VCQLSNSLVHEQDGVIDSTHRDSHALSRLMHVYTSSISFATSNDSLERLLP